MKLIDTHCHLCHGRLRNQVDDVLARAQAAGVTAVICAAANLHESKAALGLARRRPDVYCLAGIHPHDAKEAPPDYLRKIEQLASEGENVGIGEIGLDYHYNYSPPIEQQRVFAEQLELAGRIGKKIVVHTREAFDETMGILADSGVCGDDVIFHSWTAGESDIRRALDFGATISFSGIVTFKNATHLRDAARLVPPDRL
ncbi:MAG: TatD family hydrolase, partial [Planctomycetota bacterium]